MGYLPIKIANGLLPASDPAGVTTDGAGKRRYIEYDDTTEESIRISFVMPPGYGSAFKLGLYFACKNTQSGSKNAGFNASVDKRTPNSDAIDLETDSFDTVNAFQHALAADQPAGLLRFVEGSLSNMDSAVAGDLIVIKIARNVAVSDDMSGDIELLEDGYVSWTDA